MNHENHDEEGGDHAAHEKEARILDALHELYLAAGLSDEHARLSARADYDHHFRELTPCACAA